MWHVRFGMVDFSNHTAIIALRAMMARKNQVFAKADSETIDGEITAIKYSDNSSGVCFRSFLIHHCTIPTKLLETWLTQKSSGTRLSLNSRPFSIRVEISSLPMLRLWHLIPLFVPLLQISSLLNDA